MLLGLFIIALSLVHFWRYGKASQSDNEKTRSSAWWLIVAGVFTALTGANIVSRASRTAPSYSTPALSDNSGSTITMTDPKTGKQTTVPLTNEEMKQYQSDPASVLTQKAMENQTPH